MSRGLGEFDLIDRILATLGDAAARDILAPPGDDAAAWAVEGAATVVTTDALVEGSHWRADTMTWGDVGWRAIAANVSDLAAMGATPRFAVVALGLPPSLDLEAIDCLAAGMAAACRAHGVRIAGGDIVRAEPAFIAVTAFGHAERVAGELRALRRDGALPGDAVAVSGHLGAAAAGLAIIDAGRAAEPSLALLLAAHRRPQARAALGQAAVAVGVRCGIDISDGLLQDLGHIARRSGAGIEVAIEALPLHPAAVAALGGAAARDLALGGGEDFELVLAGSEATLRALATADLRVTVIGRAVAEHPGEVWALDAAGARSEPASRGWDHLREGSS